MLRLVTFRDFDPWYRCDASGWNKIGYVTASDQVLYPLRTHLALSRLANIKGISRMFSFPDSEHDQSVEAYFTKNKPHVGLFFRGISEIMKHDYSLFEQPIRLPILQPYPPQHFKQKWNDFVAKLEPGDLIMTVDTKSFTSKLVAAIDHGTWSHSGMYVGHGRICEAIPGGVTEREIKYYESHRYRLGAYRVKASPEQIITMIAFNKAQIGKPYSYLKVALLGLRKLVIPLTEGKSSASPNDVAALGPGRLISVI